MNDMFWATQALSVATILPAVACTWHLACFSLEDYMTRRLKKRFPNIVFV